MIRNAGRVLVVLIAAALSVTLLIVIFQAATGDWEGGESGVVWTIAGFVGVLTLLAWTAALPVVRSSERPPLRFLLGGSVIVAGLVTWWALF